MGESKNKSEQQDVFEKRILTNRREYSQPTPETKVQRTHMVEGQTKQQFQNKERRRTDIPKVVSTLIQLSEHQWIDSRLPFRDPFPKVDSTLVQLSEHL